PVLHLQPAGVDRAVARALAGGRAGPAGAGRAQRGGRDPPGAEPARADAHAAARPAGPRGRRRWRRAGRRGRYGGQAMKPVRDLLGRVRLRLLRDRAVTWGANGVAAGALLALAVELVYRRWPLDPAWPGVVGAVAIGLVVASAGWALAWPSWAEVARFADARLGGRERLTTALQFAGEGGWGYGRQRDDAVAFAQRADLASLDRVSPPFKVLAVAAGAAAVALALALLPNPALQQLRERRAELTAQDQAAGQVEQVAR